MSSSNPSMLKSEVEVAGEVPTLLPVSLPPHLTLRGINCDPHLLQRSYEIMSYVMNTTQNIFDHCPIDSSRPNHTSDTRSLNSWQNIKPRIQEFHTSLFNSTPESFETRSGLMSYAKLFREVTREFEYIIGASSRRVRESKGEDLQACEDKETIKDLMTVCTDMSNYLESAAKTDERTMRLLTTACENGKKILEAQRQKSESVDVSSVESVS